MKLNAIKLLFLASFILSTGDSFAQNEKPVAEELKKMERELKAMDQEMKKEDVIFKVVERMPRFPGCEDKGLENREEERCALNIMLEYIYENLEYPEEAKAKGIEGMVVVQFLIDNKGNILDPKVVRDLEREACIKSCGDAALEMMKKMQKDVTWIPGKQRGRAVTVQYTLPIKFDLDMTK